jgi:adenylyl-sulfate kinase
MTAAPVFWFTGLSGAGKSTVAEAVALRLGGEGIRTIIFDGDDVRTRLNVHLGFTPPEIEENNRLISNLCIAERGNYDAVFVPIISPYRRSRQAARESIGSNFFLIWFSAALDVVAERDTKGLYAKAASGEMDNLIGVGTSNVFEPPLEADLLIDSSRESEQDSIAEFEKFVRACLVKAAGSRQ